MGARRLDGSGLPGSARMAPGGVRMAFGADKVIRVACDCEHGVAQRIDDDVGCNAHENDLTGIAVGRQADASSRTEIIATVGAHSNSRDAHARDYEPHANSPSALAGVWGARTGGIAASTSVRAGDSDAPSDDITDCDDIFNISANHVDGCEAHVNSVVDAADRFADAADWYAEDADRFAEDADRFAAS